MYSMLHCAGPSADTAFLSLFNLSWAEGRLPYGWKDGDIKVLLKPTAPRAPQKLRPITLLKCPSKTAESMVLPRLQWQVGPLHPHVFGFVRGVCTSDSLMTLLALINHRTTIAVFLDLEKAFELACPAAILEALIRKGVRGRMLSWIEDYLCRRRSRVKFQGVTSTYREYENGTPQEGILSPFLFNLLVDVLVSLVLPRGAHLLSYADDLVLVVCRVGNKLQTAQQALDMISLKCQDLGLKISAEKSRAMHFFPPRDYPPRPRRLKVQGTQLEWTKEHIYLGVWLDQRLTFGKEVAYLKERTTARNNVMRAMTNPARGASPAVLRLFYIQAIRPLVDYAAPALVNIAKTWRKKLETTQNTAMRTILGAPIWTHVGTMQAETGLIPLELRIKQLVAGRVAKILQKDHPNEVRKSLAGHYHHLYHRKTKWNQKTAGAFSFMVDDWPQLVAEPDPPDPRFVLPPPWAPPGITFTYTPLPGSKALCTGAEMRQHALQAMDSLHSQGCRIYYTDGSVDPSTGATGSAFTTGNLVVAWRNSDHCSSLQTELVAIWKALAHAEGGPDTNIIIHTDSKAALQTLQRRYQADNIRLTTSILGLAQTMTARGIHVKLNWVPSHVGLAGNERADTAARQGTRLPDICQRVRPSLRQTRDKARGKAISEAHRIHRRMTITSRSMRWYEGATAFTSLHPALRQPRSISVAAQRLRLGYMTLAERQPGRGSLTCRHCGARARNPVLHYLLSCPDTAQLRTPPPADHPESRRARAAALVKRACEDPTVLLTVLRDAPPPR